MPGPRILVLEDDLELRDLLSRGLEEEGFDVVGASTGGEAMARVRERSVDALIIDIGLPDADGRDVCQALRAAGVQAPVLFLTARDAVSDRLSGFSAGGDDYVTKPFHLAEVSARMRALEVRYGEGRLALTPTEFRLLAALAGRHGVTLSRRELVRAAWPDGAIVHDNTLDVYVARLRRKLRTLDTPATITTVHGVGYRLQ
jgi:DNA-binding response OmpR family regulator